jgi:hypothetical protein
MLPLSRPSLLPCILLLALAAGAACSSPTAPEPLGTSLEVVQLSSEQERQAWPSTPVISGGSRIEIRGWALAGCGQLQASASRQGREVQVTILSQNADRPCVASLPAWQAFSAAVHVSPGEYTVRARTVGHEGTARSLVSVR